MSGKNSNERAPRHRGRAETAPLRGKAHSVRKTSFFKAGERLVGLCGGAAAGRYRRSLYVSTGLAGILCITAAGQPALGQSVTVTGDVTPGGPTSPIWNVLGDFLVGNSGTGTLTIENGGVVFSLTGFIGYEAGSEGTVTVAGPGSKWTDSENLHVGYFGTGTLTISDGGEVSNIIGIIGTGASSIGIFTVSGAGSKWTNTGALGVGTLGTGMLAILSGGEVSNTIGVIGEHTGSTGTVTVSGDDSKWTNTGALYVGGGSTGTLTVEDGGEVSSSTGFIGYYTGSNGTVTVSGAGSKWTNTGALGVGTLGTGTLTILGGGEVSNTTGTIGYDTGSSSTVTISGAGSKWLNSDALYVGTYGTGTLAIENGGEVSSVYALIGNGSIATGTLNLLGSAASGRGVLETGYAAKGEGNATLNLNGGILRATRDEGDFLRNFGPLTIGAEGAWFDTNGHSITIDGSTTFSGAGTLNKTGAGTLTLTGDSSTHTGNTEVNGGTLAIASGGTFGSSIGLIGNGVGSTGTVSVSGAGSKWTNANALYVGGGGTGTLTIENGGEVSSFFGLIGNGVGSTGTVTVSGAGSKWTNTSSLNIGSLGTGGLIIDNAGEVSSTTGVIGNGTASNGTVSVSGSGSKWTNANALYVGHLGTGTLTISDGGTVSASNGSGTVILGNENIGTITIGTAAGAAGAEAGTLEAASVEFWNGNGTLNFNHTGETFFSAALLSNGSGTHAVNHLAGTTTLSGVSSGFTGTTTVLGGTLLVGDAAGNGILGGLVKVGQSGTLGGSGTLTGAVTIDGTLSAGNSPGTLTFTNNLTLNAGSTSVFELNSPGTVGGTGARGNDLVRADGNLTLGGELDARVASAGYYRLFEYGGTRLGTFAGGTVTGTGGFVPLDRNTADIRYAVTGQVNLSVLGAGQTLQFWDGSGPTFNVMVDGGDGIWGSFATNWTDDTGSANSGWGGSVGVFAGAAGTVTVQGSQAFDTVQFSADGYRIEGDALTIGVAGGGTFNVDNGVSATVASIVEDGAGSLLRKAGAGTLVLTGHNTYAGGNHLLGGVLSVASDANLGAVEGGLAFDSGILKVTGTGYTGTTRTILIGAGGGGFDIADAASTFTLSQNITGTGNLLKQGDGTLVLTGANAYDSTRVEAGTLVGDAGSISGNIGNSGTVIFDQTADTSFSGNIGGLSGTEGMMIKRGGGELILAGASTLDWSVEDGTLVSSSNRFTGDLDVTSGAGFTFDQNYNGTYSGALSGAGDLAFTGGGAITLTRDSSSFTGLSTVTDSTLIVNTALGGSALIGRGSMFGGSGTIGSGAGSLVTIAAGGTLTPGNPIGTLTVDGDLVFETGSHLAVEVNPQGRESDLVKVTGRAMINGGGVVHIGANANYDLRSTYTILSAEELVGTFEEITSNFAFLNPDLIYNYGAGTVDLELARNDRDFASAALTRNQVATAKGIESIGFDAGHAVYDAIAQLADNTDLIRASFDALSGEIHASAKAALIEDSRFVRNAINDRVRAAFGDTGASVTPILAYGPDDTPTPVAADHAGPAFWSHGFGSWSSTDSDGNAASLDRSSGGLLGGTDGMVGDWRIGLLAGYSHSSFKASDRASSVSSDNYYLGFYGGTHWGDLALRTGAAYTWHHIDTARWVSIPGISDSLSAGYNAGTVQAFGEMGYGFEMGNGVRFEPFANLAHVSLRSNGFTEAGGNAALTGYSQTTNVTFTTLGLRGEHAVTLGAVDATFKGMLGWQHAFGLTTPTSTNAFTAGDAFSIASSPIARDSAVIEAGLDLDLTPNTTFGLSYTGQIAAYARDHGFRASFNVSF